MSQSNLLTEVIPGIDHWSGRHPGIGVTVHSHYLTEQRVAIDPVGVEGLTEALRDAGGVEQVILANRHHLRGAEEIASEFGAAIRVPRAGLNEFEGPDAPRVIAYDWGDEVADGVIAHEVGSLAPDDGALHVLIGPGALAFADSLVMDDQGLGFVPDQLMDDPPRTKEGLLTAFRRLLDLEFDALLLAHGAPIPADGKAALAAFTESPRSASF